MPRVRRKTKLRHDYTANERKCLLTGIVLPFSTRFGVVHPKFGNKRLDIGAIREAWDALGPELVIEWQGDEYAKYREWNARPWAERVLEAEQCQG